MVSDNASWRKEWLRLGVLKPPGVNACGNGRQEVVVCKLERGSSANVISVGAE